MTKLCRDGHMRSERDQFINEFPPNCSDSFLFVQGQKVSAVTGERKARILVYATKTQAIVTSTSSI
jgi:hypothetical protein